MSDKRKKKKFAEKREARRLQELAADGRLVDGEEIPLGAVVADAAQQVLNNSYDAPPAYYVDVDFRCRDCGHEETWTAQQQKWYYEVAKGSLYATADRCHECRQKVRDRKLLGGDPSPLKHVVGLMKHVRSKTEPAILAAGFTFDAKNKPRQPRVESTWLDYSRRDMLFRLLFDPQTATLKAETIRDEGGYRCEVTTQFDRALTNEALMALIDAFAQDTSALLSRLALPP